MEKLEKLEKVVPVPDTTFYGAYYYDGKDIELCDDIERRKWRRRHIYSCKRHN